METINNSKTDNIDPREVEIALELAMLSNQEFQTPDQLEIPNIKYSTAIKNWYKYKGNAQFEDFVSALVERDKMKLSQDRFHRLSLAVGMLIGPRIKSADKLFATKSANPSEPEQAYLPDERYRPYDP